MKLCLIVYKIDPVAGSENASGYHLAKQILRQYPMATVISRRDNIEILKRDPHFEKANLIGIDVPKILSFYKNKSRGIILYYYLWQYCVGRVVRALDQQNRFDVIHQINFHADWAPHFLQSPQARIIWGPIAHHEPVPFSWYRYSSTLKRLLELLNRTAKALFWSCNPWLRQAMQRSDVILFANHNVPKPYQSFASKVKHVLYAGSHWQITAKPHEIVGFNVLFVGRLVALKGPHVALDAFAYFLSQVKIDPLHKPTLTVIGSGALSDHLTKQAVELNKRYGPVVTMHPWLKRAKLRSYYQQADYLLYPSLEAQGLVVSEAISQHCRPITLADTGPAAISQNEELTITPSSRDYDACVIAYGEKLVQLYQTRGAHASERLERTNTDRALALRWPVLAQEITMFYDKANG